MATREQYLTALRNAHNAGDTTAAQRLAQAIQGLGSDQFAMPEPRTPNPIEGAAASATRGLTLGFSDKLGAGAAALASYVDPREGAQGAFEGMSLPERYDALKQQTYGNADRFAEEYPVTSTVAEVGGGLATGGVGGTRALAGKVGRDFVMESARQGAALGLLSGAGYSREEDFAQDAALGGATGLVGAGLFAGGGQVLSKAKDRLARSAQQAGGLKLTPGEAYDSNMLRRLEASMESFPLTTGAFQGLRQQNQGLLNSAAAGAIGETGEKVTDEVLDAAHRNIGSVFDDLTRGRKIPVDDALQATVGNLDDDIARGLFDRDVGEKALNRFREQVVQNGELTDDMYQRMSSQISKKLRSPNLEWEDKEILAGIKSAMDDAVERSLGEDELMRFRDAREKWRNLVMLEKGRTVNEAGDVSGRLLANTLRREDPSGYVRGQNQSELYNLARGSQRYAPLVGDSGTATRMALPLMTQGLLGAGGGSFLGLDPATGAALGLLSPIGARAYLRGRLPGGGLLSNPATVGGSSVLLPGLLTRADDNPIPQ